MARVSQPSHSFTALPGGNGGRRSCDGAHPVGSLALSGSTLYGTTEWGGRWGSGTVFALNTDGTGFTNLHTFAPAPYDYSIGSYTNSEGANPTTGLDSSGNTLYGTTSGGGISGQGACSP